MAVAKIIFMCRKCEEVSGTPANCPVCKEPMETTAVVNAYDLQLIIKKLATPEGVVVILNMLDRFLEDVPATNKSR